MTTFLHITQIVDRIQTTIELNTPVRKSDLAALELLLPESKGSDLFRPTQRLVMALRQERKARMKNRITSSVAQHRVERRVGAIRAALAKHARDVAAHTAGIELHA